MTSEPTTYLPWKAQEQAVLCVPVRQQAVGLHQVVRRQQVYHVAVDGGHGGRAGGQLFEYSRQKKQSGYMKQAVSTSTGCVSQSPSYNRQKPRAVTLLGGQDDADNDDLTRHRCRRNTIN